MRFLSASAILLLFLDRHRPATANAGSGGGDGGPPAPVTSSLPLPEGRESAREGQTRGHEEERTEEVGKQRGHQRQQKQQQEQPPQQQQQDVREFELWEASKFPEVLAEWAEAYPDLIRVTTAQEAYGLPAAGTDQDCPFYGTAGSGGCPNYVFTIQDYVAHPEGGSSSGRLPEVLWSGCLHGDERVGPTSVMEAAALLLEAARCEGLPRRDTANAATNANKSLAGQLKEARTCRQRLRSKGVDDVHRRWLARLVTTRRIVVVPTANALGYFRNEREEGGVDPNRDFPYDLQGTAEAASCMQTVAGRTLNEVYREHLFQLALTFHAGMEAIGYEWGAPSWSGKLSPDDEAQKQIGGAYSRYGGGWSKSKPYQYGTMNEVVYPVRGGMEDWAYAASWTPDKVVACEPKQFGGYPKEKTQYNNSTLRVFNMLIETSNRKEPKKGDLGTSLDVLSRDTGGNGHVSRNVRLALLSAELVEPYVSIVAVNKLALADDIVPLTTRDPKSCMDTKAVMIAKNAQEMYIEWTIGGAMTVDLTELWVAKWDDVAEEVDCWTQPSKIAGFQLAQSFFHGATNGTGQFSVQGPHPTPEESRTGVAPSKGPLFRATIPIQGFKQSDKLMVIVSARVDQSWIQLPSDIAPYVNPQSHVVNARTNPDWHHESNGKHVDGRLDWFSVPLTVVFGDFKDSVGTQDEDDLTTIELHPRFGDGSNTKGGVKPKAAETDQLWFPVSIWKLLPFLFIILLCLVCTLMSCYSSKGHTDGMTLVKDDDYDDSDDFVFESKPYSDRVDAEYGNAEEDDGIEIPVIS